MTTISITLPPEVEANLDWYVKCEGISRDECIKEALEELFRKELPSLLRDDWERNLLSATSSAGVSLSDEAVSSEGIYD